MLKWFYLYIGSRNHKPADQDSPVGWTLTSRYYPEWNRCNKCWEKRVRLVDLAADMVYNGIAYEVKRIAQRDPLGGKSLAESRHQGADTSWCRTGGSTTSWMNGICRLPVYSPVSRAYCSVPHFMNSVPSLRMVCPSLHTGTPSSLMVKSSL